MSAAAPEVVDSYSRETKFRDLIPGRTYKLRTHTFAVPSFVKFERFLRPADERRIGSFQYVPTGTYAELRNESYFKFYTSDANAERNNAITERLAQYRIPVKAKDLIPGVEYKIQAKGDSTSYILTFIKKDNDPIFPYFFKDSRGNRIGATDSYEFFRIDMTTFPPFNRRKHALSLAGFSGGRRKVYQTRRRCRQSRRRRSCRHRR